MHYVGLLKLLTSGTLCTCVCTDVDSNTQNMILFVVLYKYEAWPIALNEEYEQSSEQGAEKNF